jgi:thymidylate synthase ThyX
MISARIIADSKNRFGNRITTFVLTFPRIVLAEFNTHRMLSKNSASSRAIPFKKMLRLVMSNPFIPIAWMKEHKGMQGTDFHVHPVKVWILKQLWLTARNFAVVAAWLLSKAGLTKQICNRLLEPFMWHTVIATGTEWENFFALRAQDQAEIHIQELALQMLEVYNKSEAKLLKEGEWHIPFGDQFVMEKLGEVYDKLYYNPSLYVSFPAVIDDIKVRIATARCARVSYMNFEGKDDYEADIKLYDRLSSSGHFSPFEHCAKAMTEEEYIYNINGKLEDGVFEIPAPKEEAEGWCGNFRGFIQLRKTLQGENKSDSRVIKKAA